jgi:hypothetical protein
MNTRSLTLERLRAVLNYNPETGVFTRDGKVAGCRHRAGYIVITIDQVQHSAHRLAWLYVTGVNPDHDIEHRDLDKSNNRFANLRPCNDSTNQANTRRPLRNTSGHKGVTWHKGVGKWQASIARGKYLGIFDCPVAAHLAYVVAADRLYGEYARAA